jgi:hypothetical protein
MPPFVFVKLFILENIHLLYTPTGNPWCDCTTIGKPSLRLNSADMAVARGRSTCRASDEKLERAEYSEGKNTAGNRSDVFFRQILRDARFVQGGGMAVFTTG